MSEAYLLPAILLVFILYVIRLSELIKEKHVTSLCAIIDKIESNNTLSASDSNNATEIHNTTSTSQDSNSAAKKTDVKIFENAIGKVSIKKGFCCLMFNSKAFFYFTENEKTYVSKQHVSYESKSVHKKVIYQLVLITVFIVTSTLIISILAKLHHIAYPNQMFAVIFVNLMPLIINDILIAKFRRGNGLEKRTRGGECDNYYEESVIIKDIIPIDSNTQSQNVEEAPQCRSTPLDDHRLEEEISNTQSQNVSFTFKISEEFFKELSKEKRHTEGPAPIQGPMPIQGPTRIKDPTPQEDPASEEIQLLALLVEEAPQGRSTPLDDH